MLEINQLSVLKNIGKTIAAQLNQVGIYTPSQLAEIGPVEAYLLIKSNNPGKTIPVCYYLYSLQGAITGTHWNDLPANVKKQLVEAAKIERES